MKAHAVLLVGSIAIVALAAASGCNRAPAAATQIPATPDAAKVLQSMFDTLAGTRQLMFTAIRELDPALAAVSGIVPESTRIDVSVSRPQMMRARSASASGTRTLYADGQHVSLLDEAMNVYATEPLTGTIDDVAAALDTRFGFTPPLAEFLVNDPSKRFNAQMRSSRYAGAESIDGIPCDRLTLVGDIADADLWIAVADHLPRKLVATFKDREGSPQLTVEFLEWHLNATLNESTFAFVPPDDAERILMAPIEEASK